MKNVSIQEPISELLNLYIQRGFGSMNKNDFEVFIFGLILEMEPYKGKNNYELSLMLHIPETKIKRLRYESALKRTDEKTDYKQEVFLLLEHAQLRTDDKKIVFQVEDVLLKSYISSILKKEGRMLDTSFNPELVVLRLDDFQYLAEKVYPEGGIENVIAEAQKLVKESNEKKITWRDVMGWVVTGAVEGVTSSVTSSVTTNLTPTGIISIIKKLFK